MLRAMGVAAVLLSVACAQTNRLADEGPPRPDEPDRGVGDAAVLGDAAVVDDVGPVDQGGPPGPILDPLELQRTIATGRRLATRFWRLPDGLEVEGVEGNLRDRELETLCTELPGRVTMSGDIRCVPNESVFAAGSSAESTLGTYADAACTQLTLPPGPADCPARFVTVSGRVAPPLVFRETSERSSTFFRPVGAECLPETRPFDAPRPVAEIVTDGELVAAEESVQAFGAVAERTVRWTDGTVIVRREPTEACTYVRSRSTFRFLPSCISGFDADDIDGISPTVTFEDAECDAEPVLQLTPAGWDEIAQRGDSREHAITLTPDRQDYEIPPLRGGLEEIDDPISIFYQRTADGACIGRMRSNTHLVRLGGSVPITTFPTLVRAELGSGRIRALRRVDAEGVAWPYASFTSFRDADLDEECYPRIALDGARRCLPLWTASATGRNALSPDALEFADAACTETVIRSPGDDPPRYASSLSDAGDETCRVLSLGQLPRSARRMAIYEIGASLELDGAFARLSHGRCVAAPGGVFATLDLVPASSFAEVEIVESP